MPAVVELLAGPVDVLGEAPGIYEFDVAWELRDCFTIRSGWSEQGRYTIHGRNLAQQLLDRLSPVIEKLSRGEVLLLRLDRIRATAEFTDEIVKNLVCSIAPESRRLKERAIVLVNPDEGTKISVHRALLAEKDACMVLETDVKPWMLSCAGKVQRNHREILTYIRSEQETTSKDIADKFNITPNDASTRLKELYEDGMIRRLPSISEEGKLSYVYTKFDPYLSMNPGQQVSELRYDFMK